MAFRIHLAKDQFKLSVAHFTLFPDKPAERLHGHNYYLSFELCLRDIRRDELMAFDFNVVKPALSRLTASFDETVLLPEQAHALTIHKNGTQVEVTLGEKFYSFPAEDVRLLPLTNTTAEGLAEYFAQRLSSELSLLGVAAWIDTLVVELEETRGQSVSYTLSLGK